MDVVYNVLKKIPGVSDEEVHQAASKLSRADDLATKADLAELKAEMYQLNNRTIMWVGGVGIAIVLTVLLK